MGFTLGLKSKREGVIIEYFLFLVSAFGSERKRLSFHSPVLTLYIKQARGFYE